MAMRRWPLGRRGAEEGRGVERAGIRSVLRRQGRALSEARRAITALRQALLDARHGQGMAALAALPLTPREKEVVRWMAAGKTNSEIGTILGTSPRTVQTHLRHIYAKLGVPGRVGALARLFRGGG